MHNSLLLSHYDQYVAAGNHKHGFLCEVQGFLHQGAELAIAHAIIKSYFCY